MSVEEKTTIQLIPHPSGLKTTTFYSDIATLDEAVSSGLFPLKFAGIGSFAYKYGIDANTARWWFYLSDEERNVVTLKPEDMWELDKNNRVVSKETK